jgi:hypothetical protein
MAHASDIARAAYYKKWYKQNREKRLAYFAEHAEYYRRYTKKWKQQHPAQVKLQKKRYRVRQQEKL